MRIYHYHSLHKSVLYRKTPSLQNVSFLTLNNSSLLLSNSKKLYTNTTNNMNNVDWFGLILKSRWNWNWNWNWLLNSKNTPHGFGRFFPNANKTKTKTKTTTNNNKSTGNSNKPPPPSGGKKSPNNKQDNNAWINYITGLAITSYLIFTMFSDKELASGKEINWQEFVTNYLTKGKVDHLVIVNKQICKVYLRNEHEAMIIKSDNNASWDLKEHFDGNIQETTTSDQSLSTTPSTNSKSTRPTMNSQHAKYYFAIGSVESFERKLEMIQRELGIHSKDFVPVQYIQSTDWLSEFGKLAPTILIIGAWLFLMRGMSGMGGGGGPGGVSNIFKIGKSNAKMIGKDTKMDVTFKDVAGCDEAKQEILEFVSFLKDPSKFTRLGAKIPKGALLCGPPGTGKTLLAKATAGEASVPFFSISGSDFIEMFVGVGPSRVRDLFTKARENAPCIVFIDEIDAVARARSKGGFSGGNDERENTLNQLLVEMDGFSTKEGVVVMAGTNRIDILDPAILRPGRFDRQITVDLPDIKGRKEIFQVHLKDLQVEIEMEEVAQRLAALTPGFSGAQIHNLCNEAAILAAREDSNKVKMDHFERATDRVIGGLEKRNAVMTPQERKTVAYHEAGHAVVGWFLEHTDPLLKVTIIPRMSGALGFAQYLPKELALHSEEQILDKMSMALGGRIAEEITFGSVTTGASDDLDRVTKMAYSVVSIYGMNDKIGHVSFPPQEGRMPIYSDKTAELIDNEVKKLVDKAYDRAKQLLLEKRDAVAAVAERLLSHETITQHDVSSLIGPRPFANPQTYDEFLNAAKANAAMNQEDKDEKDSQEEEEQTEEITPNISPA